MGIFINNLQSVQKLREVECFLLDLDGVFSQLTKIFKHHARQTLVKTVFCLGTPLVDGRAMTEEEALDLAIISHYVDGTCFSVFRHEFRFSLAHFLKKYPKKIRYSLAGPCQVTAEQLRACDFKMAIFSNSGLGWIKRMLKWFDLTRVVEEKDIPLIGREDIGDCVKPGVSAYLLALGKLRWKSGATITIDDSLKNLEAAKKAGLMTVYVTYGRDFNPAEHPHVDIAVDNLAVFLELAKTIRENSPRGPTSLPSTPSRFLLRGQDCRLTVRQTSIHDHK